MAPLYGLYKTTQTVYLVFMVVDTTLRANRSNYLGATAGIIGNLTHVPLLLVAAGWLLPHMPDLASAETVSAFYYDNASLIKWVLILACAGLPFYLWFSQTVNGRLRASPSNPLTWLSFATELCIWIVYLVTLGLLATAELLHEQLSAESLLLVHGAAMLLAAPLALTGSTYFVVFIALNNEVRAFPVWMNWVAVAAAVGNFGSFFGFFTTTGPFNASNGFVGVVVPLLTYGLFANTLGVLIVRDMRAEDSRV